MPSGLVVKSGLNTRSTSSAAIPTPVSATDTITRSPSYDSALTVKILWSSFAAMASVAFTMRFNSTCWSCTRFPITSGTCKFAAA